MPNSLGPTGLTLNTQAELITYFSNAYKTIYGTDINLGQDTPDGQWMMINIQAILDVEDLLMQVYNQFDPDNAIGNVLDQRVAINGIQRQAGTYTVTNVTIVVSQAISIFGLDQVAIAPFTVADNQGNKWELQATVNIPGPGTYVYSFRSAIPGAVLSVPNTITVPVTIVLGVTSINNPTSYSVLGINEESDADLKIRRQKSVSLSSQGYLAGLLAALENIPGMASAFVYENVTGTTDDDSIPGHSIWVIVSGTALPASIANAIYTKRNAGCGMKGSTTYNIVQADSTNFTIRWDVVTAENLFITFNASSLDGVNPPDVASIRAGLVNNFVPGVYEQVNINDLATAVQNIDNNTLVTVAGFSAGMVQVLGLSGVSASGTFKLNYNGGQTSAINWNDAIGTIQTKVRAVTGLSTAVVTGSIASQTITITLTTLSSVAGLAYVSDNTLATSAPAAITFTYSEGYTNTLLPTSKDKQFAVSSANIIIVPIVMSPAAPTVVHGGAIAFAALGGYGAYTYSIATNNSGGTINSTTGAYTSGATPSTDVVRAVDALGNLVNTNVVVS